MKLFLKISISAIWILMMFSAKSQEFYESANAISIQSNNLKYKLTGSQYYFSETLYGTVYFNEDWEKGSVLLKNGDRIDNVYLKLNTFSEELIVFNERTGAIMILDNFIIDEFEINSASNSYKLFRKIYFDKYPKGEHYYNVIYDGKIKLLIWHVTSEVKTSVYTDGHGFLRDSEFKQEQIYFLVFPDGNIVKMANKRRAFIHVLPEQKKAIRKLFRKNNIHFGSSLSEIARAVKLIEEEFFSK